MTVLSSSYGIIMYREINSSGHVKNFVDGPNATNKTYLERKLEIIGKSGNKDITKIGIIPDASKTSPFIQILYNKELLNGLKGITKMKHRESLFKYQSSI